MLRWLRSALRDNRANVAVTVALSLAPLSLAALGALDIARATAAKLVLQDALDAATLATAKSTASDATQLQTTGDRILHQNLVLDSSVTLASDMFVFGTGGTVVANASAAVRPLVIGFITGGNIIVGAHTEVKRAGYELEIALVLDNTGSMQGTKLKNLKTAAGNFIDTMAKAAAQTTDPNAVKISLVPFSQSVRVDSSYASATWLDVNGASTANNALFPDDNGAPQQTRRFDLFNQLGITWAGCVEMRKPPYDIDDTAPDSTAEALVVPYFAPDEPDNSDSNGQGYSNNYIKDKSGHTNQRGAQSDTAKYKNASVNAWSSRGPNNGCDMQALQRLTTNWTALKSAISSMKATGQTNIPLGMAWGWHTLSPNTPFADGVAYGTPKHKKIVILMTDGENTMFNAPNMGSTPTNANVTDYNGAGYLWEGRLLNPTTGQPLVSGTEADRTAALDDRLQKLCANMKAKDIEIYTLRVEVTNGTSTVLQSCASGADHYFDVKNSASLDAIFQQIANGIASLHLSK